MKAKDRIEELERRVRELEQRPIAYPPVYIPQPYPVPYYPSPYYVLPWIPPQPPYVIVSTTSGCITFSEGL